MSHKDMRNAFLYFLYELHTTYDSFQKTNFDFHNNFSKNIAITDGYFIHIYRDKISHKHKV